MNNPRTIFRTLSDLYQFNRKLIKAYGIPTSTPLRISENYTSPPPSASPGFCNSMSDPAEIFDLYDAEEYRVIGRATRGACHGNPALVHAVARVHVRDEQGRFLLQLRSATKDIQPGKWDTSVGGHLLPGEEAEAAARREMREELGVDPGELVFLNRFLMRTPVETEWVTSFATLHSGPFTPDPGEIDDLRFWTRAEIAAALGTGVLTPAFENEFVGLAKT